MSTKYFPPIYMHPVDVTTLEQVADLKLAAYPKHVVAVPDGVYIVITNEAVFMWHNDQLIEITSIGVTDNIFGSLMPAAFKYNCSISCIVYHKKMDISLLKDELLKKSDVCTLNYEDFTFVILDAFCKATPGNSVVLRTGLMYDIDEYASDSNVYVAPYQSVNSCDELLAFATKELLEDKTCSILCKTSVSMYIDNVQYIRSTFKPYSTYIRLGCNLLYEGVITAAFSLEKEITDDINITVISRYTVKWKDTSIVNVDLINPMNNSDLQDILILRKLHRDNASKFINKPILFTGFSTKPGDIPIGCTFLRFQSL